MYFSLEARSDTSIKTINLSLDARSSTPLDLNISHEARSATSLKTINSCVAVDVSYVVVDVSCVVADVPGHL